MKFTSMCTSWKSVAAAGAAVALAVTAFAGSATVHAAPAAAAGISARNLPADGKVKLFIGQDSDTISDYKQAAVGAGAPNPGGVTLYTNIVLGGSPAPLAGVDGPVNYGTGTMDFPSTLQQNPNAALAVGLYLSDSTSGCGNQPLRAIIGRNDSDVTSGSPNLITQYRQQVDTMVNKLQATGHQIFLRIGYEYDGPWNCYNADFYKQAFRYIKGRIDALGGTRIATVWQGAAWPLNTNTDHPEYNYIVTDAAHYDTWYPGDDVVDWVGMSAFYGANYKDPQWSCANTDVTPRSLQDRILNFARGHGKPVMIAESAPQGFTTGAKTKSCIQNKAPVGTTGSEIWNNWYADYFSYIEANTDVIRAVAYINTNWDSQALWQCNGSAGSSGCPNGYWGDSRVQADPTVLSNWISEISKPIFAG